MATLELSDLVGESSSSLWKKLDDEESKLLLLGGIIVSFWIVQRSCLNKFLKSGGVYLRYRGMSFGPKKTKWAWGHLEKMAQVWKKGNDSIAAGRIFVLSHGRFHPPFATNPTGDARRAYHVQLNNRSQEMVVGLVSSFHSSSSLSRVPLSPLVFTCDLLPVHWEFGGSTLYSFVHPHRLWGLGIAD